MVMFMDMENIHGQLVINMLVIGKIINAMDMEKRLNDTLKTGKERRQISVIVIDCKPT